MKKLISMLAVLALVTVSAVSVCAAGINSSEKKVLDYIETGVEVNGQTVTVPDNYMVQAENYLNTIDLTEDQANQIIAAVDKAKAYVKKYSITTFDGLSRTHKEALLSFAQEAASVVGLKVTIVNGNNVVITDSNGTTVATFEAAIKVTGGQADFTNAAVIGVVILGILGAAAFAAYKYRLVKE